MYGHEAANEAENPWTFMVFLDSQGRDIIHKWVDDERISVKGRAKIDRRLCYLQTQSQWDSRDVKKLEGGLDVWEVRISHGRLQYRLLGCMGPAPRQFMLTVGAFEKSGRFVPPHAPPTAYERCQIAQQDRRRVREYF